MKYEHEVIDVLTNSEVDGYYVTNTTIAIKLINFTSKKDYDYSELWICFDCKAQIIKDENVIDSFIEEKHFLIELNGLIARKVKAVSFCNAKLILEFNDKMTQLILSEDEDDDSEEIWSIYSKFKFDYGEWIFSFNKNKGVIQNSAAINKLK